MTAFDPINEQNVKALLETEFEKMKGALLGIEKRMGLRSGTLHILSEPSDFMLVMKACTTIEPLLHDAFRTVIAEKFKVTGPDSQLEFENSGGEALSDLVVKARYEDKLKLARKLGLLDERQIGFISALNVFRNHYAHHVSNVHLSLIDVLNKQREQSKRDKIVRGILGTIPLWEEHPDVALFQLRTTIFNKFAGLLVSLLSAVEPSPLKVLMDALGVKHGIPILENTGLPTIKGQDDA